MAGPRLLFKSAIASRRTSASSATHPFCNNSPSLNSVLKGRRCDPEETGYFELYVDRQSPVKLSFFGLLSILRILPPLTAQDNGLQVASLIDLAGMQASVVQMRAEAKDYIDIDAFVTSGGITLASALAAARMIYASLCNPQSTLEALSYCGDGNLRSFPRALKDRLARAARDVDLDTLPILSGP